MSKTAWLVCLAALVPGAAAAQSPIQSVEVSGGYYAWGGEDLDGFEGGPRGQVTLFFASPSNFSFGLTGTYGWGGLEGFDKNYHELGFGGTGRVTFDTPGALDFYLGGYAGWTRLSVDLEPTFPKVEVNGFAVGPSAGVELPVGGIRLNLGGEALWESLANIRLSGGGGLDTGSEKAWRFGARVGLVLGGGD